MGKEVVMHISDMKGGIIFSFTHLVESASI